MIASLITALYLLGLIAASKASMFLYVCGVMLIAAEIAVTLSGVLAFNGILALAVGYTIQSGQTFFFGLPVDWTLLFGIGVLEVFVVAVSVWIVLRDQGRIPTTGTEAMRGEIAAVVEWKGKSGIVLVQGEHWKAFTDIPADFSRGDGVKIEAVKGLKLKITV
ncbi:MAG: hypothetical protein K9G62_07000 [Alphaproteobacteria bacterium]|nr:hypothetical protein [Alphaproteobacteria bacterium]